MIGLGMPAGPIEVLCLRAHPDDVEIGCGGALLQLADRAGTTVRSVLLIGSASAPAVKLLNAHYPSQATHDWWDDDLFLGLMRVRGMEARAPYAEGFYGSKALLHLADGGDCV